MADLAQIRSGFVGLTTALSPEATPPGGLLEAENVCIRTQNVITPRPGFDGANLSTTNPALGIIPYPIDTNAVSIVHDGTTTKWTNGDPLTDENGGALAWEAYTGVVQRRSLFLCTADALRVVHSPTAGDAYRAGTPAPGLSYLVTPTVTSTGGPAYAAAGYRAYRVVTRRGGVLSRQSHISRSAPSNRLVHRRTTAGNFNGILVVLAERDFQVGDVIELYSTEVEDTYPTDEMYLNAEVTITAAHITAGYVEVQDELPDAGLRAALYTNASREGSEAGNYRPPRAGCMAEFNGSLWLGDLRYTAQMGLVVPMLHTVGSEADTLHVGVRLGTAGTFTNGGTSVTSVSAADIAQIKVGMFVANTGAANWGRVATVGATSFTLVANWSGASGAQAFVMHDSIRIGSEYYLAQGIAENINGAAAPLVYQGLNPSTTSALYTARWAGDLPTSSVGTAVYTNTFFTAELYLEALTPAITAPQVWATNGHLYSPELPEPTVATGYQMPQEVLPDNVAWSKADEPDHFPLTNIERVGRSGSTVYDMKASRGSLLLFTDLGTWRGSGYADSGIAFSELDKDVRILGRRCAAEAGPNVYVWADNGVYECDENGCNSITDDKLSDLDEPAALIALLRSSLARVTGNAKNDEVIVCAPAAAASTSFTALYVFNQATRAWTKWVAPRALTDLVTVGPSQLLTGTRQDAAATILERLPSSSSYGCDAAGSGVVTVNTVAGTTVTIAAASGYTPLVGDVIAADSAPTVKFLITEVASATVFTVHTTGLATGSATTYGAVSCLVTPSVNTAKTPHFMKAWAEGTLQWARRAGVYSFSLAFRSAITGLNTATTQTRRLSTTLGANSDARSAPATSRFIVPRAAARGTHLCFSLTIRQALSDWAIEALSVRCRTTADKAPARLP